MSIPFLQAKHYSPGNNDHPTRIVIHSAECNEAEGAAHAVARYFQTVARPASAHYVVDDREVWQCVKETDTAFHAPPNAHTLGIELCGRASQRAQDWADPYSTAELAIAARLVADLCDAHQLPAVFLDAKALKDGRRGVTTHAEVSRAWRQTTHTDPGPDFPMAGFLAQVQALLDGAAPPPQHTVTLPPLPPPTTFGDDMPLTRTPARITLDDRGGWTVVPVPFDHVISCLIIGGDDYSYDGAFHIAPDPGGTKVTLAEPGNPGAVDVVVWSITT